MSAKPLNLNNVKVSFTAKSREEASLKMWKTVVLNQKGYNFSDPVKEGDIYVVWYWADVLNDKHIDSGKEHILGIEDGTDSE